MKILIGADTYFPDINGASYFTQRLATALSLRGHTVHVLCPSRSRAAEQLIRQRVVIHGIPSLPLPIQDGFRCAIKDVAGNRFL